MNVFRYIEDKDVFQKFYSKTLARRLVYNQSVSEDAEASMISKLKEACGFEYTAKLQRMFQDVNATRELNAKFSDYLQKQEEVNGSTIKGTLTIQEDGSSSMVRLSEKKFISVSSLFHMMSHLKVSR
ncbi:putative cullin [Schistosoma mansoni]|uniref:Putative cullin n=1 Tax=Schistosoma mansoni TaxID=6183 RepID=G4VHP1_SCHMA|nr:putative cullin [Schistosoma mansoni]|eukprot:XP_018652507.1 putative cullin [Schistosoma mansoni]